jgi:hypothetical protein
LNSSINTELRNKMQPFIANKKSTEIMLTLAETGGRLYSVHNRHSSQFDRFEDARECRFTPGPNLCANSVEFAKQDPRRKASSSTERLHYMSKKINQDKLKAIQEDIEALKA